MSMLFLPKHFKGGHVSPEKRVIIMDLDDVTPICLKNSTIPILERRYGARVQVGNKLR